MEAAGCKFVGVVVDVLVGYSAWFTGQVARPEFIERESVCVYMCTCLWKVNSLAVN